MFKTRAPVLERKPRAKVDAPYVATQNRLKTLRKHAVKRGMVLNPSGARGFYSHDTQEIELKYAWRPEAMKRKRKVLLQKKAVALEFHELQMIARENATLAMNTLVEISGNKRAPEATRIAASSVILDRAYGKASQTTISANIGNGKTNELTGDELNKRVELALKRVEAITNRAPKAGAGKDRPAHLRKLH